MFAGLILRIFTVYWILGISRYLDNFSDESDSRYNDKDNNFDFKDNHEEFTTYHEKTKTTHTEKITTKRRTEKKKIDLGAAASQLGKDQDAQVDTGELPLRVI